MKRSVEQEVADVHSREWGRVLAVVVRVTRDLDLAEDAVQDAFTTALRTWPRDGIPRNPGAWLTTTARNRAVDQVRRATSLAQRLPLLIVETEQSSRIDAFAADEPIPDERLRLIFTCCHPALAPEARIALTLRLICGLTTAEIAQLFLVSEARMAARITRGKKKIARAGIPYRVPDRAQWGERLPAVLLVIYLVFTEGHTATGGNALARPELTARALELVAVLRELIPDEPEVGALHALILLTYARHGSRTDETGDLVLLEHQDRSRWDHTAIASGIALVEDALRASRARGPGPYALQAAIAAIHAEAPTYEATDWPQILALYDILLGIHPSPVIAIGRAVALGMARGPQAGLATLDMLAADPQLATYAALPTAQADLLRRAGRYHDAARAYIAAARLTSNGVIQTYLNRRIAEMDRLAQQCDVPGA